LTLADDYYAHKNKDLSFQGLLSWDQIWIATGVKTSLQNTVITVEHTKTGEARKIPMNELLTSTLKDVKKR